MDTETPPALSGTLLLDRVGDVVVTLNSDGISWSAVDNVSGASFCLGMAMNLKTEEEIKFSNIYAVEFIGWGLIYDFVWKGGLLLGKNSEMNRFVVHGFYKKKNYNSPWVLSSYIFGHEDFQTCKLWVDRLHARINMEVGRPKSLLVFVHPQCGKENGRKTWESVAPLFVRAKVKTIVSLTKRAGHAYDIVRSSTNRELNAVDGIVTVGGDGLFHEVLNGLLRSRHKDPYPPPPPEFNFPENGVKHQDNNKNGSNCRASIDGPSDEVPESLFKSDDQEPLISTSESSGLSPSKAITENGSCDTDQDNEFSFPNDRFRLGIIPAGSTDAIVMSTTGVRDSVTSALQIILGKKISLDIAQVVRWKHTTSSVDVPSVHYAASFAGYGFYGDVIKESEKYRWMGPKRYDFVGTKVFLEHRSYEAEVTFLEDKKIDPNPKPEKIQCGPQRSLSLRKNPEKVYCRVNCTICNKTEISSVDDERGITNASIQSEDSRWVRTKGRFLSVGAAVISCRNEKAPDGLVADAHLGDGFLHLILVKDCSRPCYLWHLTQLTRRGGNPLNFKFVEHHKTRAFTFMANHDESSWNLDGELLQGCQVTVRACRGLVNLFASGPEV